ncbi:MAG: DUF4301 family protein [Thermodesulfobacteriota bacterium]|nr:DUF4301 family protein [Thermodesulfobacteriota bacterium]
MTGQDFTDTDMEQIEAHGLSKERVERQLAMFKSGVTIPTLVAPCTAGNGVKQLDDDTEIQALIRQCDRAAKNGRITKFVPASGAASRMFKALLAVYHDTTPVDRDTTLERAENGDDNYTALLDFMDSLDKFAFYNALSDAMAADGLDCGQLVKDGDYQTVLAYLLTDKGLNLAGRPKGMIPFHRHASDTATPQALTAFEEHIAEAVACFTDNDNTCHLHFTVPESHQSQIESLVRKTCDTWQQTGQITVQAGFSIQDPATDTIAVDMDNRPFRDEDGRMIFRPGGHGALLSNLNALNGDILLLKNIDNIAKPTLREKTAWALKAICGLLVDLQQGIAGHVRQLNSESWDSAAVDAAMDFVTCRLDITPPESIRAQSPKNQRDFLLSILNRPTRVCGVVKNEGEPGGGPFFVRDNTGMVSGQIIESVQVNMDDPAQKKIWESATHFNPVIIACGVRDAAGSPFDLTRFADPQAGIITEKSYKGRSLKALEHPGLWNGAMAFWNTVFVAIPSSTFNPVKTVFDLLRDGHREED